MRGRPCWVRAVTVIEEVVVRAKGKRRTSSHPCMNSYTSASEKEQRSKDSETEAANFGKAKP